MLRREGEGKRGIYSQGEEQCVSSPSFYAIQMTAGLSCPGLFYIKLRQMLDFPHYGYRIWLIQLLPMFSVISQYPEGPALSGHWPPVSFCALLRGILYSVAALQCMQQCTWTKEIIRCTVSPWTLHNNVLTLYSFKFISIYINPCIY